MAGMKLMARRDGSCCCGGYIETLGVKGANNSSAGFRGRLFGSNTATRLFDFTSLPSGGVGTKAVRYEDNFPGDAVAEITFSVGTSKIYNLDAATGVIGSQEFAPPGAGTMPPFHGLGLSGQGNATAVYRIFTGGIFTQHFVGGLTGGGKFPAAEADWLRSLNSNLDDGEGGFGLISVPVTVYDHSRSRLYVLGENPAIDHNDGTDDNHDRSIDAWCEVWDYQGNGDWKMVKEIPRTYAFGIGEIYAILGSDGSLYSREDANPAGIVTAHIFKIDPDTFAKTEIGSVQFDLTPAGSPAHTQLDEHYPFNPSSRLVRDDGIDCIYFGCLNPVRVRTDCDHVTRVWPDAILEFPFGSIFARDSYCVVKDTTRLPGCSSQ